MYLKAWRIQYQQYGYLPNTITIYNPVLSNTLYKKSRLQLRNKIFEKTQRDFILNVGRLEKQKNHSLLIDAFSIISEKIDLDLVILGKKSKSFFRKK